MVEVDESLVVEADAIRSEITVRLDHLGFSGGVGVRAFRSGAESGASHMATASKKWK
jgi:hypothetical protein